MLFSSIVRKVALGSAAALVAGVGLVVPSAPAQAVAGISGAGLTSAKVAVPASGATTSDLRLTFSGPVDATTTYSAAVKVTAIKSPVKKSKRKLPTASVPATVTPGAANPVKVGYSIYTSRGEYKVTVVVTQKVNGVVTSTATVASKLIVHHHDAISDSKTTIGTVYYYLTAKSKLRFTAKAPSYMAGAKVKVRYTTDGVHFSTIATAKVSSSGKIKVKTKKITVPSTFYLGLVIASRPYADGYTHWGKFVK